MSSYTSATIPTIEDEHIRKALHGLLATNWSSLPHEVRDQVQAALSKGGPGSEILQDAWQAADAVYKFADKLVQMRMQLDDENTDGNVSGSLTHVYQNGTGAKLEVGAALS
jgi:hypothetical protein